MNNCSSGVRPGWRGRLRRALMKSMAAAGAANGREVEEARDAAGQGVGQPRRALQAGDVQPARLGGRERRRQACLHPPARVAREDDERGLWTS